ncbi:hypothetical protein Asp14428_27240 [Actinoplanes sp. NBRC 14428]|nr:hypothetical protein Asp14428_27240 [Actinoplanes sp. NBRC 14428]
MATTGSETWVFGGTRIDSIGRHAHVWLCVETGQLLWYAARGTFTLGCEYTVQTTRNDGRVIKHGDPVYRGWHADTAVRRRLAALDGTDYRRPADPTAVQA